MRKIRALLVRLAGLLPNGRRERELTDEIEAHLEMHIDDNVRAGMSREEARRQAMLKLGGIEVTKEAYRDRRSLPVLDHLFQDLRFAVRQLRKNAGFSTIAILVLALGICASVSIFAFVDAALIKPLPYNDPSRLVGVYESIPLCQLCNLSYADYLDWKRMNTVFSSLDVYSGNGMLMRTRGGAEMVASARVTAGFFRTLGVTPALGRDFREGEDLPSAARAVMLTYSAWQKRYGGRPDVLGESITLNDQPHAVLGVLPPDFHFAPIGPAEYVTVFHANPGCDQRRSCHGLYGVARLKDGVSLETAASNIALIARQLEQHYPESNRGQGSNIVPLTEVISGKVRPILMVLLGGAAMLLLIATVNVVSLLLVRAENRRREIAVRSGLGASRARLISQFITEGCVLVAAAAVIGVATAAWAMQLLTRMIPKDLLDNMPYLSGLGLNAHVLLFAGAVSMAAAALFSVTPAMRLRISDLREDLAEGSRGSAGTTWRRFASNLVILELATAMALLMGAGLLGKSLYRLLEVNIGMQPEHLATLRVASEPVRYTKPEQMRVLEQRVMDRLANLPGVKSVALTSRLPMQNGNTTWIRVVGHPWHGEHNEVSYRQVSPGYFTTLGAKLIRGRYFTEAEDASKPLVTIIDQSVAKKYFPGEDPIGKKILSGETSMEVVGIIEDVKEGALDETTWPTMFVPLDQDPENNFYAVVRTSQADAPMLPVLVRAVHEIDPSLSTFDEKTMMDRIQNSPPAYLRRSAAWLVGGFAALALVLGVIGLYGVIAYSVSQRAREIGIRMALGAQPGSVYSLVMSEAGRLIAAGLAIGIVGSALAERLLRGMLFGVSAWDMTTLTAVAVVLGISAVAASFVPAHRAASVNPVEALRTE